MTRISATEGDSGYSQYLVCKANDKWPKVLLDGAEVENIITADSDRGLIVKIVMDETNRPMIDIDGPGFLTERLNGEVSLVWEAAA